MPARSIEAAQDQRLPVCVGHGRTGIIMASFAFMGAAARPLSVAHKPLLCSPHRSARSFGCSFKRVFG